MCNITRTDRPKDCAPWVALGKPAAATLVDPRGFAPLAEEPLLMVETVWAKSSKVMTMKFLMLLVSTLCGSSSIASIVPGYDSTSGERENNP